MSGSSESDQEYLFENDPDVESGEETTTSGGEYTVHFSDDDEAVQDARLQPPPAAEAPLQPPPAAYEHGRPLLSLTAPTRGNQF